MDYLFLHRDKRTFTSERQKNLLFKGCPALLGAEVCGQRSGSEKESRL